MFKQQHYPTWGENPYGISKIPAETPTEQDVYLLLAPEPHKVHPEQDTYVWTGRITLSVYAINPLNLTEPTLNHQGLNYTADTMPPRPATGAADEADAFYDELMAYGANPDLLGAISSAVANFAELLQVEPDISLADYWFAGVKGGGDYIPGESEEEAMARLLEENPALETAIESIRNGDFHIGVNKGVHEYEPTALQDVERGAGWEEGVKGALANLLRRRAVDFADGADSECANGFIHTCSKGKRGKMSLYRSVRSKYIEKRAEIPEQAAKSIEDYLSFLKSYGTNRDIEQVIGYSNNGLITVEWGREGVIFGEFIFLGEGRVSGGVYITKKSSPENLLAGDEIVDTKFSQIFTADELVEIMDKYQEI